jgi:FkbM family methyltransferase
MLERMKRVILNSPLGPVAKYIHRLYGRQGNSHPQSTRYDQETIETMRRVLEPDSCCIDVGAHRGSILREMVRIAPRGRHYAFEPLPYLAEDLRSRFPGVRVYEAAVSDGTGTASFIHIENAPAYSGLQQRLYRFQPVLKPITVDVVRLDEVIPSEERVAFIKLDIEGGEFDALRGAARTIGRCRPVIVFEAGVRSTGQYGATPEEVYRFIAEQLGYHLSTMQRWLAGQSPHGLTEFSRNWYDGPDFYFIAYPRSLAGPGI